jgi:glycosyltransferase involved in cell wall biosynthesis
MSQNYDPLRIMFFPSDPFGCGSYRMIMPAKALSRSGYTCFVSFDFKTAQDLSYDLYHFQRITTPTGMKAIDFLLERGKTVIMDMDDDLFSLYPGHPSAWYFRKGYECLSCGNTRIPAVLKEQKCPKCGSPKVEYQDRLKICSDAMAKVDAMTFSTPELAERYEKSCKRSYVLSNYMDREFFKNLSQKNDDYIAVGWAGSFTHEIDILEMGHIVRAINEHPDAYLFMVGVNPQLLDERFKNLISHGKMIILDPVPIELYPELLTNFDIGLAPIVDNVFNRCKSELKIIEYGAVGIPVIASPVAPYLRYVEHGVTGFIAKKRKDWYAHLKTLLEDAELRKKLGEANKQKALQMDLDNNLHYRKAAYANIIKESGKQVTGAVQANPFKIMGKTTTKIGQ